MKHLILFFLTLFSSILYSQSGVSGLIIDGEFNDLLPFANIIVIETGNGTTSDLDGKYYLELNDGSYTIEYSFVGYDKKRVTGVLVSKNKITNLDVVLEPSSNALEEVVITTTAQKKH
jgi:hypothetical protein